MATSSLSPSTMVSSALLPGNASSPATTAHSNSTVIRPISNSPRSVARPPNEKTHLPPSFYDCDINYLVHLTADMLCTLTNHNNQIPVTRANLTRFHSRAPPAISISDYLKRIVKYALVEKAILLVILVYIDRICELHQTFTISSLTVHRFIIASITVAAKAICDSYCTNAHYAKVGGISTQELNTLELDFLFLMNWKVAVKEQTCQEYYINLVRQHCEFSRDASDGADASNEGSLRGSERATSAGSSTGSSK